MSEPGGTPDENGEKWLEVGTESVFVGADGRTTVEWSAHSQGMSQDEVMEATAEAYGVDPDIMRIESRGPGKRGRNKSSASFGNWRSSWDPKGDPSLN